MDKRNYSIHRNCCRKFYTYAQIACLISLFSFSQKSFSYVDLSLNYSYGKVIGGVDNTYESVSTVYSGVWAWYIFNYTALEFNYSSGSDIITDTRAVNIDLGTDVMHITESKNTVSTSVNGIGIRQALAPRDARILPAISIGYAKQTTKGITSYKYHINDDEEDVKELLKEGDKVETDSSYVALTIRFKITEFFGITLAGRSVFPGNDTSQANKNVRYNAGISWLF